MRELAASDKLAFPSQLVARTGVGKRSLSDSIHPAILVYLAIGLHRIGDLNSI